MLIKILSSYCLRPGLDVSAGDVVDATPQEARYAFALRRAVPASQEANPADQDEQPAPAKTARNWSRRK